MSDETFRPRRPQNNNSETPENVNQTFDDIQNIRQQAERDEMEEEAQAAPQTYNPKAKMPSSDTGMKIKGNVPPQFQQALQAVRNQNKEDRQDIRQTGTSNPTQQNRQVSSAGSDHLKELLTNLKLNSTTFEEVELPSKGRFYDGKDGPSDGVIRIRPMTGEEEQILATPRFVRKGQALNMIFSKCISDNVKAENLLTADRTYLLIYLRGISYSPEYDVEIKCPECEKKFNTTIDLNSLFVNTCPDDHGPMLQDVTPTTKLPFTYRYSTGKDEQELNEYRDRRIKMFGDQSADDTLIYRTAMLLGDIDGISNKNELQVLLKNLPINDVSYMRNCINEPPFGVDTNVEIICPSCLQDFEVDLPLEANFFFPRRKKNKTQA
jgi:hypothetical protein